MLGRQHSHTHKSIIVEVKLAKAFGGCLGSWHNEWLTIDSRRWHSP
jgi:hypothetical protein